MECNGFTLSELLVSLSILGLIAALTLPSIFNAVQTQQRKALYLDTIRTLQEAVYKSHINGDGVISLVDLFDKHLSYVKKCTGSDRDCDVYRTNHNGKTGFLLSNGVTLDNSSGCCELSSVGY